MRDFATEYRPDVWDSIVGQEALTKTLQNQIKSGSVAHAYLFCGPRGTGKTTTGKVFAKAVDAQIIEMDAASNNGVENIRDLRQDVMYLPVDNKKYKAYIIDEVHMLSTGAFNALLKTLEEPPAHVIFILATTDPQKLPTTIVSRCQRFDLKRISQDDIIRRLGHIVERESLKVEFDALEYIAKSVDGGMRDAIKLLQKCSSLADNIEVQTVVDALGSVNVIHLENMTNMLVSKDLKGALQYFNNLVKEGTDVKIFIADFVQHLTDTMTTRVSNNDTAIEELTILADEMLDLLYKLRNMTQIKTITELRIIKLCKGTINVGIAEGPDEETAAQQRKVVNEAIQSNSDNYDTDVIKRITDTLSAHEKRFMADEMIIDQLQKRR